LVSVAPICAGGVANTALPQTVYLDLGVGMEQERMGRERADIGRGRDETVRGVEGSLKERGMTRLTIHHCWQVC